MSPRSDDAERSFFRAEFAQRVLVIALDHDPTRTDAVLHQISETIVDLMGCGSRVVVAATQTDAHKLSMLNQSVQVAAPRGSEDLANLWITLDSGQHLVVCVVDDPIAQGAKLAVSMRVTKLVLTDPGGGWGTSFAAAEDLSQEHARSPIADAINHALNGGVDGVNLCLPEDLDRELFTFDGAGTLFTRDAYVTIRAIGADDLRVVEELFQRGISEGFLRDRARVDLVRLAMHGLGAHVAPYQHLVGVGALEWERYATEHIAEVSCLYTLNRFSGEGIASDLINGLIQKADAMQCKAVFACTISERAADVFLRAGFVAVSQERIPPAKWAGYDQSRRAQLKTLWLDRSPSLATSRCER